MGKCGDGSSPSEAHGEAWEDIGWVGGELLLGTFDACLDIHLSETKAGLMLPHIFSRAATRSSMGGWVLKSLFTVPFISLRGLTI